MALLKICLLGVTLFVGASATNVAILTENQFFDETTMDLKGMEKVFLRSDEAHTQSMTNIMNGMTMQHAEEVIQRNNLSSPALMQVTNMMKNSNLRRQPKGYSGIDGARKLLNDMIFESMMKYDQEIAKCTEYYSLQCMEMEVLRGEIAASNYIAANSRSLILDSQGTINKCEVDIPVTKLELKNHNHKCEQELSKLNSRLKIVLGDIAVMTTILEMTDCEKKFVQMEKFALLHCHDKCTKGSFVTFNHASLQQKVSQLQGEQSKKLLKDTLTDLASGIEGLEMSEEVSLFEIKSHLHQESVDKQDPVLNKTTFNNPPLPRTEVPSNPCNDPDAGAPSAADKRAAKCTIKKSPQCYKLQERFLLIQSGIQDERDELMDEIQDLETFCEETKKTLETQISNDEDMLESAQTKLAQATEKEATAAETARQTAIKHEQMKHDLDKQMKTCSQNYINFETEQCALKKIRGELYKMKGGGHSAFFQDCELSKWGPEECTKSCATGTQKLIRTVLTHPDKGTGCLPLEAIRTCNNFPCPVDCKLNAWSGWSKCSAECGGGVQQRLREVVRAMKYDGQPCGKTSETKSCNNQACEKDCELSDWSIWGKCSKDCDGGTRKRQKFVAMPAQGEGKCADEWDPERLEYKQCNMRKCVVDSPVKPLECNKTLDVVLLLDGSGSLGKKGWAAEIKAANFFVDAFMLSTGTQAEMSVILYSGPRTWGGVKKCIGGGGKAAKGEECGIKTVTDFTDDLKKVKVLINQLEWPRGSTLTSLALMTAKAELSLGRESAHSVVVAITDGRPLSYRKTEIASRVLRQKARLVWVPVTKYAPLAKIKKWATRRWQENVVRVKSFKDLEKAETVTHIIADICPKSNPDKVKMPRLSM